MEQSDAPRPSPRREVALQGPRPTPLRVSKDSHKIRKPPVAPAHAQQQPPQQAAPQYLQHPRPPVIIYSVSPKVIHAQPGDFMALVQRLTGLSGSADASSAADPFMAAHDPFLPSPSGALSPAARIASFELSQSLAHAQAPDTADRPQVGVMDQLDMDAVGVMVNRPSFLSGILSPVPSTLPPISPFIFSPSFDQSMLNFLHDLSPMFATNPAVNAGAAAATNSTTNNWSFMDIGGSSFLTSPSNNLFPTPTVPSPGAYWDLLNQF